ncbi:MAG: hypothetical protein Q9160_008606 [Pyrenula sp. 1 TL-2023]
MAGIAIIRDSDNATSDDRIRVEGNGVVSASNIVVLRPHDVSQPGQFLGYCLHEKEVDKGKDSAALQLDRIQTSEAPSQAVLSEVFLEDLPRHLCPPPKDGANNLHFIISTQAGTRKALKFFDDAVKPLIDSLGICDYDRHVTTSEHTISQLTESIFLPRANRGTEQTIVLLSGDGGLVDIINVIMSNGMEIGAAVPSVSLLPLGTGNALAHSSGLTRDSTSGLRKMIKGTPKALPMFQVEISSGSELVTNEGRDKAPLDTPKGSATNLPALSGAVVCSWGIHASLVADSDTAEYRKHGADRFAMAAKELLNPADGSESHRYRADITVDKHDDGGQKIRHLLDRKEHMYILVTLVSDLQQGFTISPHSEPLDGQLRLVHFGYLEPAEATKILGLAYQGGKHIYNEAVGYEPVHTIRIDFREPEERWRRVCVDGKIIAVEEGGWMEVSKIHRNFVSLVA